MRGFSSTGIGGRRVRYGAAVDGNYSRMQFSKALLSAVISRAGKEGGKKFAALPAQLVGRPLSQLDGSAHSTHAPCREVAARERDRKIERRSERSSSFRGSAARGATRCPSALLRNAHGRPLATSIERARPFFIRVRTDSLRIIKLAS